MIFVFVIQQYNLMVWLDFSIMGYDSQVSRSSRFLAGIAISIADDGKSL